MKLVSTAANPVPDQAICATVVTPDNVHLRVARWAPPSACKGTVVLLQGRTEFIEKYFETIRDLRSRGFAVVAFDWRGQGLSDRIIGDPNKGHVRSFSDYAIDLKVIMEQVVLPDCPPPIFALGHSMGGAIVIRTCHDGERWFERIVLCAPLIALPGAWTNRFGAPVLRCMRLMGGGSAYAHRETAIDMNFATNRLTSDPVRHARNIGVLQDEPALGLGAPTIAWADEALRLMKAFAKPAYVATIRQPILMIAAGNDEIVSVKAIETFAVNLLAGRQLIIPGAKHEILQEQDRYRSQFWAAFDAFIPGASRY
jgi:lysophospholipase